MRSRAKRGNTIHRWGTPVAFNDQPKEGRLDTSDNWGCRRQNCIRLGLVNDVVPYKELDEAVEKL